MLYDIPHLAGADDPSDPWWPLDNDEADALAKPSARMLARMPKAKQEAVSRFLDPIALLLAAVVITQSRVERSISYVKSQRIAQEERNIVERTFRGNRNRTRQAETDGAVPSAVDGTPVPEDQAVRTRDGRDNHRLVQDIYSQD